MEKLKLERQLGQYLSFLKQRIREEQQVGREESLAGSIASGEREKAYQRAEEELRKLFPQIDFYISPKDER